MPLVGTIIPLKALGVGAQEKRIAREKEDQRRAITKGGVKRAADQAEFSTPEVTEVEAPREVRGNGSEETSEDRKQQAIYDRAEADQPIGHAAWSRYQRSVPPTGFTPRIGSSRADAPGSVIFAIVGAFFEPVTSTAMKREALISR